MVVLCITSKRHKIRSIVEVVTRRITAAAALPSFVDNNLRNVKKKFVLTHTRRNECFVVHIQCNWIRNTVNAIS